jgi:hypothetical protein
MPTPIPPPDPTPPTPSDHPSSWLYENHLESVPASIGRLKQLQRLWLDRNRLTELPAEIAGCSKLQVGRRGLGGWHLMSLTN